MSLALCLPLELLYYISKCLNDTDLSSWSRSCRALRAALTPLLYDNVKQNPRIIRWASDRGRLDTVQRLLDAGANPNMAWAQKEPRWWTLGDLHDAQHNEHNAQPDRHRIPFLPSEASRSPSSQPEEPLSRHPQSERNHADFDLFVSDVSDWLTTTADIENEMIEDFQEGPYSIDDGDIDVLPGWDLEEKDYLQPYNSFPQRCYWTPLHIAAASGNDKLVNLLLDNGADINALSRLFCKCVTLHNRFVAPLWTPLHTSMCHGHESTARLLLSRGASTYITAQSWGRGKDQYTALHSACTVGLLDAARSLIEGGYQTDVTVRDHAEQTPLAYAFFQGNWPIIDFLMEHGADINAKIGPLNPLGHACLLGYYAEALRLLDLGATPQCEPGMNGDPSYFDLIAVAGAPDFPSSRASKQKKFRLELLNRLIKHGIDINQQGVNGVTALMEAASFHRVDVVKALLHSGADVRIVNIGFFGMCALQKAILLESKESQETPKGAMLDTVRVLLEAMAETPASRLRKSDSNESDAADIDISNAFRIICTLPYKHEDKLEVVDLLLKYRRSVELPNLKQDLVYQSIMGKNFKISDLLLENGFNQPDEMHLEDLVNHSLRNDRAEGLCYILNHFPDTAPRIRSGQFLCDAVDMGSQQCAGFLINEGVSIHFRNEDGSSLLFAACQVGDTRTAELLLKRGADPDECTQEGALLTTVAALHEDRRMVRLLLDYGASIHSSPPGKPTRYPDMGFLDIALTFRLIDAIEEIVNHKNFGCPTDEEISRHWQTIIKAPGSTGYLDVMLGTLLGSKGFDQDQVFAITNDESGGSVLTTPLHLCAAIGLIINRISLIKGLIGNGADIHKNFLVRTNGQNHTSKPKSSLSSVMEFEGTTPLEWAISFSSVRVVRAFLGKEVSVYGQFLSPEMEKMETRMELMLLYAKAACRRQKPEMFSLLFKKGLDPTICDEDGNTIIHMICDYVETFWPNDEPEWTMECIAERSAFSLVACLKWSVAYHSKNEKGESGMDRILQILRYTGDCEFHRTLAKNWSGKIAYIGGSSPELMAKCDAPDDEEESDDEGSDEDTSDDELSDGGLDSDSGMSDDESDSNEWLSHIFI